MSELTTQQQMVLEQQYRRYDVVESTGEHLDSKAATVLQAGAFVIALTGVVALPDVVRSPQPPVPVLIGIAVAFGLFLGMILCAIWAWRPAGHKQAGAVTWEEAFDAYINEDSDGCFRQVLSDLLGATAANMTRNERKARYVTAAVWLLALQVASILALAVAAELLPL